MFFKSYRKSQHRNYHQNRKNLDRDIPKWEDFKNRRRRKRDDDSESFFATDTFKYGSILIVTGVVSVASFFSMNRLHDVVEKQNIGLAEVGKDIEILYEKLSPPFPELFESEKIIEYIFPGYVEDSISEAINIINSPNNSEAKAILETILNSKEYSLSGDWKFCANGVLQQNHTASMNILITVPVYDHQSNLKCKMVIETYPKSYLPPTTLSTSIDYLIKLDNVYKVTVVILTETDNVRGQNFLVFKNDEFSKGEWKEKKNLLKNGFFDHSHTVRLKKVKTDLKFSF
jgi:hypothetical protein